MLLVFEIYRKFDTSSGTSSLILERQTIHVSDDSGRIAMLEKRTIGTDDAAETLTRYVYSNHLQSASLELDGIGDIISYEEYHPYGTTAFQAKNASINAVAKRYRYTGKERDEESGLYYHGARYYIPWLCRWTAIDPMESKYAVWSPYHYVKCNPIMDTDSTGMGGDKDLNTPKGVRNGGVAGGYNGGSEAALHKASPRSIKKSVSAAKQLEFRLPTEKEWEKVSPTPKEYKLVDSYDSRPNYVPSEKNNEMSTADIFKYGTIEDFSATPFVALENTMRKAAAMLKNEPTYNRYIVEEIMNDGEYRYFNHRYIKASIHDEAKQVLNNLDAIGIMGGSSSAGTLLAKPFTVIPPSTVVEQMIRLRHYMSNKGLEGIETTMEIIVYDKNIVFAENASSKILSAADASQKYGISKSSARNYIEFEVPRSSVNVIQNATTKATEYTIKGNVKLNAETTKFSKRR